MSKGRFPRYHVGDMVRHFNTKQWAEILEVVPQFDGSYEYKIKYFDRDNAGQTSAWGSHHIDRRITKADYAKSKSFEV